MEIRRESLEASPATIFRALEVYAEPVKTTHNSRPEDPVFESLTASLWLSCRTASRLGRGASTRRQDRGVLCQENIKICGARFVVQAGSSLPAQSQARRPL